MNKFEELAPDGQDWMVRKIRDLEAQIEELRSARSGEAMAISSGGLTVKDGGAVRVRLNNGTYIFYAGPLIFGGVTYQGIMMRRADNTSIFYTFPVNGNINDIAWRWLDDLGNELVSSDAITGGMARPWIPLTGIPVLSSGIPMTTNAGYIGTWSTGSCMKQQPFIEVQALLRSDTGGTGNARYTINGVAAGSVMTIGAGAFAWQSIQKIALPGQFYHEVTVELQVQRTNGVGSVGGVFKGTQRQT